VYTKLTDLVDAVGTGEVDPACLVVRVDNDHVNAKLLAVPKAEATEDDWEDATEVWRSEYGPEHTLIDLLNGLGVPAESV